MYAYSLAMIAAGLLSFFLVSSGIAQPLPSVFSDRAGLAIRGTDPVAYFTEKKAVKGSADYTYQWKDATWRFASAANQKLFMAAPEKYAPQYGGYCAMAVASGTIAPVDPAAWSIVGGKLYLNFDRPTQTQWQQDVPGNIAKADANWPEVLEE